MKNLKFLFILLTVLAAVSSISAQQSKIERQIYFSSYFFYASSAAKVNEMIMNVENYNDWFKQNKIDAFQLSRPSAPILMGESFKYVNEKIQPLPSGAKINIGNRQNISVDFLSLSGGKINLAVKINDQPVRFLSLNEADAAILDAGLLDEQDKNSHAFLALSATLYK